MTAAELIAARQQLGDLIGREVTAADLGRAFGHTGRDPGRTVRAWETGKDPIPGAVAAFFRLALSFKAKWTRRIILDALGMAPTAPRKGRPPMTGMRGDGSSIVIPAPVLTRRRGR
jgi:hypothetical protein